MARPPYHESFNYETNVTVNSKVELLCQVVYQCTVSVLSFIIIKIHKAHNFTNKMQSMVL